jgi:hypothetical protein
MTRLSSVLIWEREVTFTADAGKPKRLKWKDSPGLQFEQKRRTIEPPTST